MPKLLNHWCLLGTLVVSLLLSACGGNGSLGDSGQPRTNDPAQLAWPPAEGPARSISADSVELLGSEFSEVGGGAHASSSVCKLNSGSAPWAIYSLGGFGSFHLDSVRVDFNKLVGEDTVLYIGVANYTIGRWQWFSTPNNGPYTFTPAVHSDYYSPLGNVHIALLRTGPATVDIQKLTYFRSGESSIGTPQNLYSDEQLPEYIGLTWDSVTGATGYNVYRSRYPDLAGLEKVNAEPVPTNDYDDEGITALRGVIYYYYVTAVGDIESEPSNTIDIFSPLIDMPAPQNPRVSAADPTSFTVAWDWDEGVYGPAPVNGWKIYVKAEPDFNLDPLITEVSKTSPLSRSAKISGLTEGSLYYFRICGVSFNSQRGRMTDDLPALTGDVWNWTESNKIGPGGTPVRALEIGNSISAIYLEKDGDTGNPTGSINFVQGLGASWDVGYCGLNNGEEFYSNYLDIDERGGTFLVSAFDSVDQDLYASFGNSSGGWTKEFVADGTAGQFDVPSAGNHCTCAITDDGYHILHKDWYARKSYLHSRPLASSSWTNQLVRDMTDGAFPLDLDMKTDGNALNWLYFDYEVHEHFFGTGPTPVTMDQISDNQGANKGINSDLLMLPSGWVSTCYDASNKDLYLLRQDGSNWTYEDISVTAGNSTGYGRSARIARYKTGLICVYLKDGNPTTWYASVFDGTEWFQQIMLLPFSPSNEAELCVINDVPYFIVEDKDEDTMYCITGNLPPIGNV